MSRKKFLDILQQDGIQYTKKIYLEYLIVIN